MAENYLLNPKPRPLFVDVKIETTMVSAFGFDFYMIIDPVPDATMVSEFYTDRYEIEE